MDKHTIKDNVKQRYAAIATQGTSCCTSACCSPQDVSVNPLVDYSALDQLPLAGSDLGLGCGAPTRFASLKPGEVVLDLGSGAGIDVFIAARAVGPAGRVIGVDMTPEMITLARQNALTHGISNVEFHLGEIEHLPLPDASVDVALSNCVINLVPDKARVFSELRRVLRPGGRFVISDMVTFGMVPETLRQDMALWAGCVAGALDEQVYLEIARQAGFALVVHTRTVYPNGEGTPIPAGADYGLASLTLEGTRQ